MWNKWSLLIMVGTLLLASCSQTKDITETPTGVPIASSIDEPATTATLASRSTQTLDLTPTNAQALTPAGPVQINLFRLVPPEFLGAGYCNLKQIMEDPDLRAAFEALPDVCPFLGSQILDNVDATISISALPAESTQTILGIVFILYGDFTEVTMPELLQAIEVEDPIPQDYQGFDLMVAEQGDPFTFAIVIMDESTIVFGEESGVKAILDTTSGLKSPPLADLGAALPQVVFASVLNNCPKYENLGCSAVVIQGLAQGTRAELSLLQLYQFEDLELAANALDTIFAGEEDEIKIQIGSIDIVGETITQDGRFIRVEGFLPIEDIGELFK